MLPVIIESAEYLNPPSGFLQRERRRGEAQERLAGDRDAHARRGEEPEDREL